MEKYRDEDGFIVLDQFVNVDKYTKDKISTFSYENKKYYMKYTIPSKMYNELIGYEIAKQLGINCVNYDLACNNGFIGVISEDFKSDGKFVYMSEILTNVFGIDNCDAANNLEDIWFALSETFKVDSIVEKLMNQIIQLYLFDILIGNVDRHNDNYGFVIKDNDINLLLFDNYLLADSYAVYLNRHAIKVDRDNDYSINDFLSISDFSFTLMLLKMIDSIDINSVYTNIMKKINGSVKLEIIKPILDTINYNINNVKKIALEKCQKKLNLNK